MRAPTAGVEPDLGLVEAEAVLAKLESLFYRPPEPSGTNEPALGDHLTFGTKQ